MVLLRLGIPAAGSRVGITSGNTDWGATVSRTGKGAVAETALLARPDNLGRAVLGGYLNFKCKRYVARGTIPLQ